MTTVTIVYHSGMGHTTKMAEAVLKGAEAVEGVTAKSIQIDGKDITEGRWKNDEVIKLLGESNGIIFGSPTYMGSVSGQMECFLDGTSAQWMGQAWKDKVAGGFSVSGGPSGDKFNTLVRFTTFAMQQGMIWVGLGALPNDDGLNRLSFYLGAGAQAGGQESPEDAPNEADRKTGEALGRRVAEITKKLHG